MNSYIGTTLNLPIYKGSIHHLQDGASTVALFFDVVA